MSDEVLLGPQRSDRPAFRFRTRLDGSFFAFRLVWNSRMQRWTLDLADAAGRDIVTGLAVVCGHDLLAWVSTEGRPAGQLFVRDDRAVGTGPDRNGWRGAFRLVYRPAADVAAAVGTADEVF